MPSVESTTTRVIIARPSPVQWVLFLILTLVGVVLGLVIILPLAIFLGVVALLARAWFRVGAWFSGLRSNGPLDGRRNVRVLDRSN